MSSRSSSVGAGNHSALCLSVLVFLLLAACDEKKAVPPAAVSPAASSSSSSTSSSTAASGSGAKPASSGLPAFDPLQVNLFAPIPEGVEKPILDEPTKLGQRLFFDKRLSAGKDVACVSCHDFAKAGQDGQVTSLGTKQQKSKRNVPTVLNAGGSFAQGWDARVTTIEELAVPHILDPAVMGIAEEKQLIAAIQAVPGYPAAFKKAFPEAQPAVSVETVGLALGTYTKKLFARSRWDRYLGGDKTVLTDAELVGFSMFVEAGCTSCHQGKYIGATQAQKLGIAKPWPPPTGTDPGRFEVTKQEIDRGMWKVPPLRNVTRTGPWLHDGSAASLEETIRLMARHQAGRELTSPQIKAIETFLGTLTGDAPSELTSRPPLP